MNKINRTPAGEAFEAIREADDNSFTRALAECTTNTPACLTDGQLKHIKHWVDSATFPIDPDKKIAGLRPVHNALLRNQREILTFALACKPMCKPCTRSGNCEIEDNL
ncbi:hypothetical protein JW758_05890 [Candidatus Peregrinibacteria bacterium]|nr:hypothetical protein [Candidatus Peregrinibacteria bacterium]